MLENLESETTTALRSLCEGQTRVPEAEWFLKEIYAHFSPRTLKEKKPELIVLGEDFPWELADARPGVLLAGSPVLFPNEKLPLLFESAGLRLTALADPVSIRMNLPGPRPGRFRRVNTLVRELAAAAPTLDVSGSQTVNRGLHTAVRELLELRQIDGIVYHVLKGQIEFDFELSAIEAIAGEFGLPVFRLETDYQPQDVEQLRIRVEAFAEMLRQNRMEGARPA